MNAKILERAIKESGQAGSQPSPVEDTRSKELPRHQVQLGMVKELLAKADRLFT